MRYFKYMDDYLIYKSENTIRKYSYSVFSSYRTKGQTLKEIIERAKTIRLSNNKGGRRKRTEREINHIKGWYGQGGITLREIGEYYGICPQRVWHIINKQ